MLPSLLQSRPTDPFIRWVVGDHEPPDAVADGPNVAWLGRASKPGESWITGMGDDPRRVVSLVEALHSRHDVDGVTVVDAAFPLLPTHLRSPDPGHWCFWMLDPADVGTVATTSVDLALDDPRIAPLLGHSDSAYIYPGDPRIVRWAGVLDGDRLVSVAGQILERTGAAHIVSVCTDPEFRGRRLAREACAGIMAAAVAEGAPMLVLEMYADNEAGRRAYRALGFVEVGTYYSGLLRPEPSPQDAHASAT
jgi:ribosomal protein S18 acetylase RimI-like enzyme